MFAVIPVTVIFASVLAIAGTDALSAWEAAGRPNNGVHEYGSWVLSCYSQPAEVGSEGFAEIDLAACKQEATIAMVEHCAGSPSSPPSLPKSLQPMVQSAVSGWLMYRVQTSGITWVRCGRSNGVDLAVMAIPATACRTIPHGIEWLPSAVDIAVSTKGWVIPGALLEASEGEARGRIATIMTERLSASIESPVGTWPSGFLKLPGGLPADIEAQLSLADLATLAAKRPGDSALWIHVAERCESMQMHQAAQIVRLLPRKAEWIGPAPMPSGRRWSSAQTNELPVALVAVVRAGGGIACNASAAVDASREATAAYFAKIPDLITAEAKGREAAALPDPDALNLLAALRLVDPQASEAAMCQALAFAWQAQALAPTHPYAKVNVLRAMRRLSMRDEAATLLKSMPPASAGSWARREIDNVKGWLYPADVVEGAPTR